MSSNPDKKDQSGIEGIREFLKTTDPAHNYVPGVIFYSRNLYFLAYDEPKNLDIAKLLTVTYPSVYMGSTLKKYKWFLIDPAKPIMLAKRELSEEKNQHEYWQVIFEEKIGWIGIRNLSEFRHYKKNQKDHLIKKDIRK